MSSVSDAKHDPERVIELLQAEVERLREEVEQLEQELTDRRKRWELANE